MADYTPIKLFVVDDYAIVREGIKSIIATSGDIGLAGEASGGLEAIRLSRQLDYQVMLLDIALGDKNGLEVLKQIKTEKPTANILMFSVYREDQYAIRALKAGASGYINKQSSTGDILTAIRQVAGGLKYISAQLAQDLANNLNQEHEDALHKTLSDREFQTLTMIASGRSVSDIAKELSLSVKTISEYRSRILLKMKLRHNAEITHYAIKNQLVD
ncbi:MULTISPECIES: response regulator transcription factor [unclassified Undibacterium]|uniref:response regulator transcription factor n=1 Tax=unclassified Undibacterium TaxID=2630295 RepID=UPI002AC8C197|nr:MULTISPECIES: response regulator transcription factor [unclassified Undibacterium]MEB0139836.1 response regulator transcription factor [Undibacterium sp. CCC2.1]MEB0172766.1 response regulator transcription factor [Undibacterium sp. CCC1.1]MEB0176558.1 response regulator transcription factor [Undibacterium sp. CCC3.4]MEB0215852.1 response regulator transcription factor [Undibacterium sp. 5I2]WPX42703.1 response regulator transcription factor [Undibacterium sp. CCC3.4]